MTQSIKPHLDKWRRPTRLTPTGASQPRRRLSIFSTLEGLIARVCDGRTAPMVNDPTTKAHSYYPPQPTTQPTSQRSLVGSARLTGEASPTAEGLRVAAMRT